MVSNEFDAKSANFVRRIIADDLRANKNEGRVHTRFPPEPNGYLHIGHAKSICLNFGLAAEFGGRCNLRFDDTNPEKEEQEFVDSIIADVHWLGFDWEDRLFFASDYFDHLYDFALDLIRKGKAYVDSQTAEAIRQTRGTLTVAGENSPFRERSIAENLDLFQRMRAGEFTDGSHVLRAKIDMAAANMNMRDPVLYRIRRRTHHRTGDRWCVYPLYDFTHCLSDALEGITHSLCTLEFEDHRALYDWVLDNLETPSRPHQYEFARLNLDYTVLSKRKLIELVAEGRVAGWDDPRMPTIAGIRRRGCPAAAIRDFCERIGITRNDTRIDLTVLENCIRESLGTDAPRAMAVLNPLKVVITNYPDGKTEDLTAPNHPQRPELGDRTIPFSREIYIERDDFMEQPAKKFFRLAPGREVRLKYAYFVTCEKVIKDPENGEIQELHCRYDPSTRGGNAADGRKVKGTLHWVAAAHAVEAEVRLYDRLFRVANPEAQEQEWLEFLNPDSLRIVHGCKLEPALQKAEPESRFQFERLGYFCVDRYDGCAQRPVFNRTVTLRDSWAKLQSK